MSPKRKKPNQKRKLPVKRNSTERGAVSSGLIVCAAVLFLAAGLGIWFHTDALGKRNDRAAAAAGHAIKMALMRYADSHQGEFPQTAEVTGGSSDILTRSGSMKSFPRNPYKEGALMKNTEPDKFSTGDFSYQRDEDKKYMFTLVVFAEKPDGGPNGDGIIYRFDSEP